MIIFPKKKRTKKIFHHRIILDGIRAFVFNVKDAGKLITVSGWNNEHHYWKVHDLVLFVNKDNTETRYCIKSIRHMSNPTDQYFMECEFKPRNLGD